MLRRYGFLCYDISQQYLPKLDRDGIAEDIKAFYRRLSTDPDVDWLGSREPVADVSRGSWVVFAVAAEQTVMAHAVVPIGQSWPKANL